MPTLNFASPEDCIRALSSEIVFQATSNWILLVLGVLVVVAIVVHFFLKHTADAAYYAFAIVVIFLGLGMAAVGVTGQVPFVNAVKPGEVTMTPTNVRSAILIGCYQLQNPKSAVPQDNGAQQDVIVAVANKESLAGALGDAFVWVFYGATRAGDAEKFGATLAGASIATKSAADDFSGVRVPKEKGTTRVLYGDVSDEPRARQLASVLASIVAGQVIVDGPYPNMSRKPLQVLLF